MISPLTFYNIPITFFVIFLIQKILLVYWSLCIFLSSIYHISSYMLEKVRSDSLDLEYDGWRNTPCNADLAIHYLYLPINSSINITNVYLYAEIWTQTTFLYMLKCNIKWNSCQYWIMHLRLICCKIQPCSDQKVAFFSYFVIHTSTVLWDIPKGLTSNVFRFMFFNATSLTVGDELRSPLLSDSKRKTLLSTTTARI